ncbi:MAG: TAXI family TRAP transporter solute-binding subunit [Syntrophobacterales bacterium]|nr:MAG: TAXI family TRAP transporter solute-binding subunit [Syntrophobacterales bacterium]
MTIPVICLVALAFILVGPSMVRAEEIFVSIGGGDISGVYFPTGLAIARMINADRQNYEIRATVEATPGSTFNLNAIMAGYMDFGLSQADKQYHAVKGVAEWAEKGPQKELRAVFSIYPESVTLVAADDAGINTIEDLKGKRVSLGNPGSSQHRVIINILEAFGINPETDIETQTVYASDAPDLLQDGLIDAYFFTVGHPNETVKRGLSGTRNAHIVPISGPAVDKLVTEKVYYTRYRIPMQRLYPDLPGPHEDVKTLAVLAMFCTSSEVPEQIVYIVTKEVFENLDYFRQQHPALAVLTKEGMLEGLQAPLHPGAMKYYREAGLMK